MFSQISRIPRQVEVRSKEKAEVAERNEPHVGREEDLSPGSGETGIGGRHDGSIRVDASDARQFHRIDAFVVLGKVPVENTEGNRPHDAQGAENVENCAPSEGEQYASANKWGDRYGEAAEEVRRALDSAAFDARKPELHAAAGHGECPGFAQSQQKASAKKRAEAERRAGHDGRGRPQRHDDGKHAFGTKAIAKPPGRNLTQRIGPRKG